MLIGIICLNVWLLWLHEKCYPVTMRILVWKKKTFFFMIKCIQSKQKQCLCWAINGKYAAQIQLKHMKKMSTTMETKMFRSRTPAEYVPLHIYRHTTHNFIFLWESNKNKNVKIMKFIDVAHRYMKVKWSSRKKEVKCNWSKPLSSIINCREKTIKWEMIMCFDIAAYSGRCM